MSDNYQVYVVLRQVITDRLGKSELNMLCFDIGVDYDDLGGDSKLEKVIELLQDIRRKNELAQLVEVGKRLRPDINWDEIIASPPPNPPPSTEASTHATAAVPPPHAAPVLSDEQILQALEPLASDGMFFHPNVPPDKAANAAESYKLPPDETILVLVDCTVFGSAKSGAAFGRAALYYHNDWSGKQPGAGMVPYNEFAKRAFTTFEQWEVSLGRQQFINAAGGVVGRARLVDLLKAIQNLIAQG